MRYLMLVLAGLYFISCDNELDLVAESKEVPVVYGILDQADTAQYVRVERIFVDEEVEPKIISQNPDSLYYEDIKVKLVRTSNGQEFILERVDGNLDGYVREDGVFASAPNYLYKILSDEIQLVQDENIELRIEGIFEDRVVRANAIVLEPPFLLNPKDNGLISFTPNQQVNIGWTPKGDAGIFTAIFYFNITETKLGEPNPIRLTWTVESNTDKSTLEADGRDFYSFLAGALEKDEMISRELNSIEFELIAGGGALQDYLRVGQANLGITSSGEIPIFSNLSEGLGVFGTTYTHRRTGIMLTPISQDSLFNGSITKELNFE